jgi:hypothetical protein
VPNRWEEKRRDEIQKAAVLHTLCTINCFDRSHVSYIRTFKQEKKTKREKRERRKIREERKNRAKACISEKFVDEIKRD